MSADLFLIRHGQAGTRTNYDTLSDKGRLQARLLGEAFRAQGIGFSAVYCGGLARQWQTAQAVSEAFGGGFPEIVREPGWTEFDIDAVHREIAPVLAGRDPAFRAEYEEIQRLAADENHAVHRHWSWSDLEIIRAWVAASVPIACETWEAFQQRIGRAFERLLRSAPSGNVAVFTSATPVAICAARLLCMTDSRARFELAGALVNTAYTRIRVEDDGVPRLASFNEAGHLGAGMRTFR